MGMLAFTQWNWSSGAQLQGKNPFAWLLPLGRRAPAADSAVDTTQLIFLCLRIGHNSTNLNKSEVMIHGTLVTSGSFEQTIEAIVSLKNAKQVFTMKAEASHPSPPKRNATTNLSTVYQCLAAFHVITWHQLTATDGQDWLMIGLGVMLPFAIYV